MAKTVFVVSGSEDGLQGVYTNKKLAWESAMSYLNNPTDVEYYDEIMTYSRLCKAHKELGWLGHSLNAKGDDVTAEITTFTLNN